MLYNLVFFGLVLKGASVFVAQLRAGQEVKISRTFGLAATSIFGFFIAVFIGIGLVWKEVERRSIYALLSKPITRTEFVLGKYAGLVLTLAVNLAVMAAALFAVLAFMHWTTPEGAREAWEAPALDPRMLVAVFLIFVELAIVTAVAVFFSTFSSPLLSAALTFGLWVVGHFNADLRNFERIVESKAVGWMARALYYVLPNLAPFDVKAQVVHAEPIAAGYVAWTAGYGVVYIALVLTAAVWIFSRRDFK